MNVFTPDAATLGNFPRFAWVDIVEKMDASYVSENAGIYAIDDAITFLDTTRNLFVDCKNAFKAIEMLEQWKWKGFSHVCLKGLDGYQPTIVGAELIGSANKNLLDQELPRQVQHQILSDLFGFNMDDYGVIWDNYDEEFYGKQENEGYKLNTIRGILSYAKKDAFQDGVNDAQRKIRQALGL